jgi:hypothetical protein
VWNKEAMMVECCASYLESARMAFLQKEEKRNIRNEEI